MEGRNIFGVDNEEIKGEVNEKDDIIHELSDKLKEFDELKIQKDKHSHILADLFDAGVIDIDGNLIVPLNRENNAQLQNGDYFISQSN